MKKPGDFSDFQSNLETRALYEETLRELKKRRELLLATLEILDDFQREKTFTKKSTLGEMSAYLSREASGAIEYSGDVRDTLTDILVSSGQIVLEELRKDLPETATYEEVVAALKAELEDATKIINSSFQ